MFRPLRLLVLVIVSLLLTALLYAIDNDPPSDGPVQWVMNAVIAFIIITLLYAAAVGIRREFRKKAAR